MMNYKLFDDYKEIINCNKLKSNLVMKKIMLLKKNIKIYENIFSFF